MMKAKEILLGLILGLVMAASGGLMLLAASARMAGELHPVSIYFTASVFSIIGVLIGIAVSRTDDSA